MSGGTRMIPALALAWLASAAALSGQSMTCIVMGTVPPTLRSEGFTELTADITLMCSGGTPTPLGTTIPTSDITIFYNTQVTSRLLNGSTQSEALLTVDEPAVSQTSATQTCTLTSACSSAVAAGPGVPNNNLPNSAEFKQAFTYTAAPEPVPGSVGAPCSPNAGTGTTCPIITNSNVFQGVVTGNSVKFSGIPIDPPGTQGQRIYRITNVRADATTIQGGGAGIPGQIQALISVPPVTQAGVPTSRLAINNPVQIVGFVQPSLNASVRDASNAGALTAPPVIPANSALTKVATLRFSELFSTAFKRRTIARQANNLSDPTVVEQNTLGLVYNSESGYYNTKLGFVAGLADSGTRFKAYFTGVPAGVRLFVDTSYASQASLALLTGSETAPYSPVAATNGSAAEVSVSGGVGAAVWEYLGNALLSTDNLDFGVYAMTAASPAPGTVAVNASYAPVGTLFGTPLPRFLDTATKVSLISTCPFSITTPATLPLGLQGAAYSPVALGSCGGTPPYSWSAGALPSGLSLSPAGVLGGVPAALGTTNFTVTLTDNAAHTISQTFSLTVVQPLIFSNTTLPAAKFGEHYSATLSASGGVPPYVWSVPNPPLPGGGLNLNPSAGVISGNIFESGTFSFLIRVTDSVGQAAVANVQLTIPESPGYFCVANVFLPSMLRGEGTSELAPDIALECYATSTGGQPTRAGATVPTTDVQVTFTGALSWDLPTDSPIDAFAIPLTGRLLADSWTEALLFIDEPAKGRRFPCDTASGICPAIGNGSGGPSYYGGGTVGTAGNSRNVFQGKKTGPNTLLFQAIPIDPPSGPSGSRILRIVNIRLNPSLASATGESPGVIMATISLNGPAPVGNPRQVVGFVQPGLGASVRNAANSETLAAPIAVEPCANPPLTKIATLRFSELFPTAFKRRAVPAQNSDPTNQTLVNQDTLGGVYNAETGFYDPSLSNGAATAARGNLALSGLADSGTRFKAVFRNVPTGVHLFVDTSYTDAPGYSQYGLSNLFQLTSSESGPFSAVPATNGSAVEVAVSNGTGTAVWEYLGQDPLDTNWGQLGVYVMASGNPAPATITLNAGSAPLGTGTAAPQFLDTSTAIKLISTQACSMNVTAPATLGPGIAGLSYGPVTLSATGGTPPYSWSAPAGSLPAGLSLSSSGALGGVPATTGMTTFTATLADSAGRTLAQTFSLTVVQPLSFAGAALPSGTSGGNYFAALAAAGGVPPYTWSLAGGSLPAGLTLNPATGSISGFNLTPGTYNFIVRVSDTLGQAATAALSFNIVPPPVSVQTAPNLPALVAGSSFSQYLAAGGGAGPYTWTLLSGTLPTALSLSAGGQLSGTPAAPGTFVFTAQVKDAEGRTDRATFTLKVNAAPLAITTGSALPAGNTGSPYAQSFSAAGGVPPYTWGMGGGFPPPGLALSKAGLLSGTPAVAGSFAFGVSLTDSTGAGSGSNFTLLIQPPVFSITTNPTLPAATAGSPYAANLAATGGTPPYRWSGSMPAGLALDPASGIVSGLPMQPGTFQFTAGVTDSTGATTSAALSLSVNMPPFQGIEFAGLPAAVADPATQPGFGLALRTPYPFRIEGRIALSFTPDNGPDDPAVQFAGGSRTLGFVIPAGAFAPVFATPVVALQTGTVAGKIELTPTWQSMGVDIAPAPVPWTMRVERRPPAITAVAATWNPDGLTVAVTGFVTTRDLRQARFRLGDGGDVTVPLAAAFAQWMADPASSAYGSQFTLIQTFADVPQFASIVSVTLSNTEGSSAVVTALVAAPI